MMPGEPSTNDPRALASISLGDVAIIIVNYCSAELVLEAVASIASTTTFGDRPRVIVVENDSPDDSADQIERGLAERFDSFAELVRADRNGGFAYGNNVGIARAFETLPSLAALFLLNPDTVVLDGSLQTLVGYLNANPEAAMVGPRLVDQPASDRDLRKATQHSAFRFPSIASEFEASAKLRWMTRLLRKQMIAPPPSDYPHVTDWLSGAAILMRRTVAEQVGPMDEGFFLYYEETDFCRRAGSLGLSSHYCPEAWIVHLEGQTTGIAHRRPRRLKSYWFDSRRRYFIKHHGRAYAIAADVAYLAGSAIYHLKRCLLLRADTTPPKMCRDLLRQGALANGNAGGGTA